MSPDEEQDKERDEDQLSRFCGVASLHRFVRVRRLHRGNRLLTAHQSSRTRFRISTFSTVKTAPAAMEQTAGVALRSRWVTQCI